jgi:Mycothiol maleylpyruvate isomerase N-terminal domain
MGKKTGSWSVKDVLAHLAVENDWLALQLERRARGEVPSPEELQHVEELGLADNHTRNTYYAQLHKDLDLASVRDWDRRANERLLTALAELPEPRLLEPDWWTFGRALGSVFDVDHDREHAQGIQRWVGQS